MWMNVCRFHQILLIFYNVRQTCTPDKISVDFSRRKTHLYTDIPVLKKHKANLMASVDMCYFTTVRLNGTASRDPVKNCDDVNKCSMNGFTKARCNSLSRERLD